MIGNWCDALCKFSTPPFPVTFPASSYRGRDNSKTRLMNLASSLLSRSSCVFRPVEIIGERDSQHLTGSIVPRAPKVEARLHAARALDRELGLGQVDLVRGEHELRLDRQRVGELEVDRCAAGRQVDQRG